MTHNARSTKATLTSLQAQKVAELTAQYGDLFRIPYESGDISIGEIDDFYGRAGSRQMAIVSSMELGYSYSAASKMSKNAIFDTKRWEKVSNRAAAARGHLLQSALRIFLNTTVKFDEGQSHELRDLAAQIADEAQALGREILACELRQGCAKPLKGKRAKLQFAKPNPARLFPFVRGQLRSALAKLRKTSRDVPQMFKHLGELQSVHQTAHTLVEIGRIIAGVPVFNAVLDKASICSYAVPNFTIKKDPWGIGDEYAFPLVGLCETLKPTRHIATHSKPDADALVSAWLAERYLFPDDLCQIKFVGGTFELSKCQNYDCVVDVGRTCNPKRSLFDHKPPAFDNRDETCASNLVWQHLRKLGKPVNHLASLIELVHDGDAATRRSCSENYTESRQTGLHALIRHAKDYCDSDQMLYQATKVLLNDLENHPPWCLKTPNS